MIFNSGGVEAKVCKFLDQKGWERMKKRREKEVEAESNLKENTKGDKKVSPKRKAPEDFRPEEGTFKVRRMRRWETGKEEQLVKSFQDAEKAQRCFEGEVKNRRGNREWKDKVELWAGTEVFMRDEEDGYLCVRCDD